MSWGFVLSLFSGDELMDIHDAIFNRPENVKRSRMAWKYNNCGLNPLQSLKVLSYSLFLIARALFGWQAKAQKEGNTDLLRKLVLAADPDLQAKLASLERCRKTGKPPKFVLITAHSAKGPLPSLPSTTSHGADGRCRAGV